MDDIVEVYPAYLNGDFKRKTKKARVIWQPKNRRYVLCEDEDGLRECYCLRPYCVYDERNDNSQSKERPDVLRARKNQRRDGWRKKR